MRRRHCRPGLDVSGCTFLDLDNKESALTPKNRPLTPRFFVTRYLLENLRSNSNSSVRSTIPFAIGWPVRPSPVPLSNEPHADVVFAEDICITG